MPDTERRKNTASQNSETELTSALERAQAMTDIVSLLTSDEPIETVMYQMISRIGSYLDISNAFIGHLHRQDDRVDFHVQWTITGRNVLIEETQNRERFWFLHGDRPLYVSCDTKLPEADREQLGQIGLTAVAVLPLVINGRIGFYVCFGECRRQRIFRQDEQQFMEDAIRILESIVMRRIQRNSLASSFASLEAILDNIGSSIYVRDTVANSLLFANRNLRDQFSSELREGRLEELFETRIDRDKKHGSYEVFYEKRNRWYEVFYTEITWVDGSAVLLLALYDITEKQLYQNKIETQAYTDFLTGLYNRMCCERDLAGFLEEARKNGTQGSVFYIDLDDFKKINDGLGHQYGDLLLRSISQAMQGVEGIHNTCYRMGGDEFVILIPPGEHDRVGEIMTDVRAVFSRPWFLKDADYYCAMSMGTAVFPTDGTSVEDVIRKADIAMYEAKKSGKNRVAAYSENLTGASSRRSDMENSLRNAAEHGYEEFEIYYQPIIDIRDEGSPCVGAEALIRWNSAQLGFLSPAEFIPLAEYLGYINPIGNHIARLACAQCRKWNDEGAKKLRIHINLSVVQLLQNDIVDRVRGILDESGLNPGNLVIEVTEALAINDLDRTKGILEKLRALGILLALDGFGTGYSSLSNLRELPFDLIKVDQGFVRDLTEDRYSQSFIRMVGELADAIGAEICVEGIETPSQYRILEGMKVRYIQGFYFNHPLSREEFEALYITTGGEKPKLR